MNDDIEKLNRDVEEHIKEYKSTKAGVYVALLLTIVSFFIYLLYFNINFFLSLILAFASWCVLVIVFGLLGNLLGRKK